jgi:cyclopropane fatty-acyl-phospholipid synthase-like methyltransferase
LYFPINHPDFLNYPSVRTTKRYQIIKPILLEYKYNTALDIGTHYGATCHFLEDLDFEVTAIESDPEFVVIANEIKNLCNKKFNIIYSSFFDVDNLEYDLVCALNIFHHFTKNQAYFEALDSFLGRLKCKALLFQSSNPSELQMENAYVNFSQDEFAEFLAKKTGLTSVRMLGVDDSERNIYFIN